MNKNTSLLCQRKRILHTISTETFPKQGLKQTRKEDKKLNNQYKMVRTLPRDQRDMCEYPMLAMVYAPRQSWRMIYDSEVALVKGTIFGELDKPFLGYGKARGCEVRR